MIPKKTDRNSESLAFLLISCTVIVQVGNEQKTKRYTTNKNKGTNKPVKIEKLLFFHGLHSIKPNRTFSVLISDISGGFGQAMVLILERFSRVKIHIARPNNLQAYHTTEVHRNRTIRYLAYSNSTT